MSEDTRTTKDTRTNEQFYRDATAYLAAELCNVEAARPGMLQPELLAHVRALLVAYTLEQLRLEGKP